MAQAKDPLLSPPRDAEEGVQAALSPHDDPQTPPGPSDGDAASPPNEESLNPPPSSPPDEPEEETPEVPSPEPSTDSADADAPDNPAAADNEEDYEAMLMAAVDQQMEPPQPGSLIEGRVIHIGESFIVMDIGYRVEGVVPVDEVADEEGRIPVQENDTLTCVVLRYGEDAEYIPLSKRQADFRATWKVLEQAYKAGEPVEGKVTRRLRGGYFLDIQGIRAFLPGSQVDIHRVQDYDAWLGRDMKVKILHLEPQKRSIVVSRRVLLEEERERRRREILTRLKPGAVLPGVVKNITDYGVFVDLGGIDGMIHKSDLAWQRVEHPSEVVEVGQKLEEKVLAFDPERERVSLGLKQLQPEPFQLAMKKYHVGDVVSATVTNVVDYGAFVELEPGVTGLIHQTEMSWSPKIRRPSQVVKPGDRVEVRVIDLNPEKRRISLSLRQVEPNPVDRFLQENPPGSVVEARVARFNMRGAIVEIEGWPEVMGFIPVREINWARKVRPPSEYLRRNQVVQGKVLRGRPDLVRVYLSIRQLLDNPWVAFAEAHEVGDVVKGVVVEKFEKGCFVRLEDHPDLEALLPRGHYLRKRVRSKRVVKEPEVDQEIEAKIIQMEAGKRRIVISQREILEEEVKKEIEEARRKRKSDKVRIGDIISQEWEKLKILTKKGKEPTEVEEGSEPTDGES